MTTRVSFTRISDAQGIDAQTVDDELRAAFGAEPNDIEWFCGWYDTIGLGLALGRSLDELRDVFENSSQLLSIIEHMDKCYAVDVWRQSK